MQDPVVLKMYMVQRIVTLPGEIVEGPLVDPRAQTLGKGGRLVLTEGIEHDHVVAPGHRGDARGKIEFLIERQKKE